jgi:hypothetical protein
MKQTLMAGMLSIQSQRSLNAKNVTKELSGPVKTATYVQQLTRIVLPVTRELPLLENA